MENAKNYGSETQEDCYLNKSIRQQVKKKEPLVLVISNGISLKNLQPRILKNAVPGTFRTVKFKRINDFNSFTDVMQHFIRYLSLDLYQETKFQNFYMFDLGKVLSEGPNQTIN